jgi:hypothetical protein
MNQDSFLKLCTSANTKTLLSGGAGSGKSSLVLDIISNFLTSRYSKDLSCAAVNNLHNILNDEIPVVYLTEDYRFNQLLKLSSSCFPKENLPLADKVVRIDNLCKIYPLSDFENTDNIDKLSDALRRHQTKLLIIDGICPELDPKLLVSWSRLFNLALIHSLPAYRSCALKSLPGVQVSSPLKQMTFSDLVFMVNPLAESSYPYLKLEVTTLKNRYQGTQKEFIYECRFAPYQVTP